MKNQATKQYKSSQYTIFVDANGFVTMCDNNTRLPHSLTNLPVMFGDIEAYMHLQTLTIQGVESYFKKLIVEGNITKLNRITCSDFQ